MIRVEVLTVNTWHLNRQKQHFVLQVVFIHATAINFVYIGIWVTETMKFCLQFQEILINHVRFVLKHE